MDKFTVTTILIFKKEQMRKQLQLGLLALIALSIGVGGYYYWFVPMGNNTSRSFMKTSKEDLKKLREQGKEIKYGLGHDVGENINARHEFETMRLRDPKTGLIPENILQKNIAFASTLPDFTAANKRLNVGDFNFTHRGPDNVGGRTRALALDINDDNTILAGGVAGGMWKSTDLGQNWTKATRTDQYHNATCVAQDIRDGQTNTWYYGTGELLGNSTSSAGAPYRGNGIYKSTDNGDSWELIQSTSSNLTVFSGGLQYINNIATDPSNLIEDEVYAAAYGQIFRSTDGFITFESVLGTGTNDNRLTDVAVTSTGIVYATIQNQGIFRSEDGLVWENITPSDFPTSFLKVKIGIAPSHENIIYFLENTSPALYKYNDTDNSWDNRSATIQSMQLGGQTVNFGSQGSYNMVLTIHPTDTNTVYIGDTNLYRSTNGFVNSVFIKHIGGYSAPNTTGLYSNHHPDQQNLVILKSSPNKMISASDGGLAFTNNGVSGATVWEPLNNAYRTTQFYALAMHKHTDDPFIMGGMQDNSTWGVFDNDANNEWVDLFSGDGAFCSTSPTSIVLSAQTAYMAAILFDEETGQQTSSGVIYPTGAGNDFLFINPLIQDHANTDRIYLGGKNKILYTDDLEHLIKTADPNTGFTTEWKTMLNGNFGGNVTALTTTNEYPNNTLIFATTEGQVYKFSNITSSYNGSLSNITGNNFPVNGYINNVTTDPNDPLSIFVVFSNFDILSVFHSSDGGENWSPVSGNLEENPDGSGAGLSTTWLSILPSGDANSYLLGTNMGLYFTSEINGMNTVWEQIGADVIGNVKVDMIESRTVDGRIAVATHGNGIYHAFVNIPFQPKIHAKNGVSDCSGIGNIIRATLKQGYSYQWFKDNTLINDKTSHILTSTESGNFHCILTNQITSDTYSTDTVSLMAGSQPDLTITETTTTLSVPPCDGCTYQWFTIFEKLDGETSNVLTLDLTQKAETYYIEVSNDCVTKARSGLIYASIEDDILANQIGLELYPNPAVIQTNMKYFLPQASEVSFDLIDNSGKVVKSIQLPKQAKGVHEQSIDVADLAKGTYIVRIKSENGAKTSRLLIQ